MTQHFGLIDNDGNVVDLDDSSGAVNVVDYAHHEIHGGNAFSHREVVDLTLNAVRDIQITTPAGLKNPHFTFEFSAEDEVEWWLYENVSIVQAGTAWTPVNHRRTSSKTSGLNCASIDNTSISNANSDTAVAGATTLAHGRVGTGGFFGGGGSAAARDEWILKPSEDYCIRFLALGAGYISYHLDWYEHTDKVSITGG